MPPTHLPYLQLITVKGRTYAYVRRAGRRRRVRGDFEMQAGRLLPSADFLASYRALAGPATAEESVEGAGPCPEPAPGTMAALIADFLASPDWAQLAPKTRRDYGRWLELLRSDYGDLPVASLPRAWVFKWRDGFAATPRTANYAVQVLSRLLSFAVDRGYRPDNPALRPRRLRTGPGHRPWEEGEVAAYRRHWPPESRQRVAFELLLNTGLRGQDVAALVRRQVAGGWIRVRQAKTGDLVELPIAAELAAVLEPWLASHDQLVVLPTETGRPFKLDHFRHFMRRAYAAAGLPGGAGGVTTHGLRTTAAVRLRELGCDEPTIAAVLGHRTTAATRVYSEKRRRASAAVRKLKGIRHG